MMLAIHLGTTQLDTLHRGSKSSRGRVGNERDDSMKLPYRASTASGHSIPHGKHLSGRGSRRAGRRRALLLGWASRCSRPSGASGGRNSQRQTREDISTSAAQGGSNTFVNVNCTPPATGRLETMPYHSVIHALYRTGIQTQSPPWRHQWPERHRRTSLTV